MGTALSWLHVLVGLDPKGIFYLHPGRELFHSLTVVDPERGLGVQGFIRFVSLTAINSLQLPRDWADGA